MPRLLSLSLSKWVDMSSKIRVLSFHFIPFHAVGLYLISLIELTSGIRVQRTIAKKTERERETFSQRKWVKENQMEQREESEISFPLLDYTKCDGHKNVEIFPSLIPSLSLLSLYYLSTISLHLFLRERERDGEGKRIKRISSLHSIPFPFFLQIH